MDEKDENTSILADKVAEEVADIPKKRPKGRPKKVLSDEEIAFKKQIQEETEKAYKEVIETKVKNNIKRELKNKALEEGVRYKDPEPKAERSVTAPPIPSINKLDEDVAVIKEAKKSIRKTLLVDKIREQVDGLDSDEDEEEIVIQKKPKVKKVVEPVAPVAPVAPIKPIITFY